MKTKTANASKNFYIERAIKPSDSELKLYKFDKRGKIYVPSLFRRLFRGYRFAVYVESGKIVLDPIKIDDLGGDQDD
ncbi:MAG: hypothetical protein QXG39_10355 [Candidatus Aenigmatarchaeota archaeon]